MSNLNNLLSEASGIIAEKIGEGEFEIVEIKRQHNAIIDVEGHHIPLFLNSHKKQVQQLGDRHILKLEFTQEQAEAAFEKINEEVERQEYEKLKAKFEGNE